MVVFVVVVLVSCAEWRGNGCCHGCVWSPLHLPSPMSCQSFSLVHSAATTSRTASSLACDPDALHLLHGGTGTHPHACNTSMVPLRSGYGCQDRGLCVVVTLRLSQHSLGMSAIPNCHFDRVKL